MHACGLCNKEIHPNSDQVKCALCHNLYHTHCILLDTPKTVTRILKTYNGIFNFMCSVCKEIDFYGTVSKLREITELWQLYKKERAKMILTKCEATAIQIDEHLHGNSVKTLRESHSQTDFHINKEASAITVTHTQNEAKEHHSGIAFDNNFLQRTNGRTIDLFDHSGLNKQSDYKPSDPFIVTSNFVISKLPDANKTAKEIEKALFQENEFFKLCEFLVERVYTVPLGATNYTNAIIKMQSNQDQTIDLAPRNIRIFATTIKMFPIDEPLQCFNCNKFGHTSKNCVHATTCRKCAGEHNYRSCTATWRACINCLNADIHDHMHTANYGGCSIRKLRVKELALHGHNLNVFNTKDNIKKKATEFNTSN